MISDSFPFAVLHFAKGGLFFFSSAATVMKSSPSRNG
jgi:hypothetical protein